eukprot:9220194-Lingulodinium_polyedra.AAC.1
MVGKLESVPATEVGRALESLLSSRSGRSPTIWTRPTARRSTAFPMSWRSRRVAGVVGPGEWRPGLWR